MQIQDAVKSGFTEMSTSAGGGGVCSAGRESHKVECIKLWQNRHQARGGEQQSSRPPEENEEDEQLKRWDTVLGTGRVGSAVQSVTQVGCKMSGPSFGHG